MKNQKPGARTLLMSIILSSPGPLVVGLGLLSGRSATQIADFARRSAELLAIIMSFVVFKITCNCDECDGKKCITWERRSNIFVGSMMCLAGVVMILIALLIHDGEKGNVIPGLIIAIIGLTGNFFFWLRYTSLNRTSPNSILAVQAKLYRAKFLVDSSVTAALLSVLIFPNSLFSYYMDFAGSIVVALYLIYCGLKTAIEAIQRKTSGAQ